MTTFYIFHKFVIKIFFKKSINKCLNVSTFKYKTNFFKKNIVCMLLLTWHSSQQLEVCNMLFLQSRHGPFFYSLLPKLHCIAFSSHGRWYQLSSTILLGLLKLGIDWESDWPSQSNIKRSIIWFFHQRSTSTSS